MKNLPELIEDRVQELNRMLPEIRNDDPDNQRKILDILISALTQIQELPVDTRPHCAQCLEHKEWFEMSDTNACKDCECENHEELEQCHRTYAYQCYPRC